jgi:hypothetical protein
MAWSGLPCNRLPTKSSVRRRQVPLWNGKFLLSDSFTPSWATPLSSKLMDKLVFFKANLKAFYKYPSGGTGNGCGQQAFTLTIKTWFLIPRNRILINKTLNPMNSSKIIGF